MRLGNLVFDLGQPLTAEDMGMSADEMKDMIGDANAKVSVSMGMAEKDFGSGFDVHVSVSLTCDQDPDVIGFAYETASEVISQMVLDAKERAQQLWEENREV